MVHVPQKDPALQEVHHKVELGLREEGMVQLDDEGMADLLQDLALRGELQVLVLREVHHGVLLQGLHGEDFAGVLLPSLVDLPIGAFADHLSKRAEMKTSKEEA